MPIKRKYIQNPKTSIAKSQQHARKAMAKIRDAKEQIFLADTYIPLPDINVGLEKKLTIEAKCYLLNIVTCLNEAAKILHEFIDYGKTKREITKENIQIEKGKLLQ